MVFWLIQKCYEILFWKKHKCNFMSLKSFMIHSSFRGKDAWCSSPNCPLEGSRGRWMSLRLGTVGTWGIISLLLHLCCLICGVILALYTRAFTFHGSQINISLHSLIFLPVSYFLISPQTEPDSSKRARGLVKMSGPKRRYTASAAAPLELHHQSL